MLYHRTTFAICVAMLMNSLSRCVQAEVDATMLDSEADFAARASAIGLQESEIAKLKAGGYTTFAKLAFATNFVPGQADDKALLVLAAEITDSDPPPGHRMPDIRRLVLESYTMAAADLHLRVDRRDEDTPRRLALAERSARYEDQCRRLSGMSLTGELEASNALIDLVHQMSEDGQLRYVRWEQCTKRDQELMGVKTDPVWKPDSNGVIKEVKVQETLTATYDTDLKLRFVLQRRSLAFDQARLLDFEAMEKWTQVLMEAYTTPPPDGYGKVGVEQIHRADLALFKVMMRETRNGIKVIGGVQPLAKALTEAMQATEPLPSSSKRKGEAFSEQDSKRLKANSPDVDKLKKTIENL